MLPYGVPFDSLSFLYLTSGHFLDFKNLLGLSPFLTPPIFYIDGRVLKRTQSERRANAERNAERTQSVTQSKKKYFPK